jgi:uncharacterized protein YjbJ (UPF0337 family)
MTSEELKGKWTQFKGTVKQRWGRLTDDEIDQIEGERERLVGKIQEKYGKSREEAEREVDDYTVRH